MASPYALGQHINISLAPQYLPLYALRTVLRMFIALFFSLLFTAIVGTLAAKNKRAEKLIIPAIDILQSIPVLSFLSITITGFIHLFPGSFLGPECACIFSIFTAQVWNMVFGFYQSLKTIPEDMQETCEIFQLSPWQRFWKVEVPCSLSGLLWNMMVSMSASWFFVVLAESISVAHQSIQLPGLGSYIAQAIQVHNLRALGYAIFTMIVVIFMYDQLLFRPLVAWSDKFNMDSSPDDESQESWLLDWIRNSYFFQKLGVVFLKVRDSFIHFPMLTRLGTTRPIKKSSSSSRTLDYVWTVSTVILLVGGIRYLGKFILQELSMHDIIHVFFLGAATASRVLILIFLSSLLWIPVGVWIGMRPRLSQTMQPIIQLAAAFPANLFYPLFVIAIYTFHLNVEIWVTPLMILGAQWYILFNVIAGTAHIPRELHLVANNLGLRGWYWWKRLILPGIFPFYITGAITAAGGAWNASIVAEYVSWGHTTYQATGLGAYIQASTTAGDFPRIALGTAMMCVYVIFFNHLFWRPLYNLAYTRFRLD
ncbi:MAG: ABC transporter permease subunit [Legionellaceae bacterium]|nr:ABC transporter permease subunit [Legionellaceae bacterium]